MFGSYDSLVEMRFRNGKMNFRNVTKNFLDTIMLFQNFESLIKHESWYSAQCAVLLFTVTHDKCILV
jgi:hypothetical protein